MEQEANPKKELVDAFVAPFQKFAKQESSGGVILLIFALLSILTANISQLNFIHDWWNIHFSVGFENFYFNKTILHWINDGLMTIFFLLVGLEIKRELLVGELSSLRKAMLPIFAAIGGMVIPAGIYAGFNYGGVASAGWGIPMATDIAFALGVLSIMGSRVSLPLKIFLTALAIVDDLGAIIILVIFYSTSISWLMLLGAFVMVILLVGLNIAGVKRLFPYMILGVMLWIFFLNSGVHSTLSGVILAFCIPSRGKFSQTTFMKIGGYHLDQFGKKKKKEIPLLMNHEQQKVLKSLDSAIQGINSPMHRLEDKIHPWVTFFIMPLFAFANAGVTIDTSILHALFSDEALGIILGLVVGKPAGILLFSFFAVKMKWANLPTGATWKHIWAIGCIGGIGFTMSIFINSLAFDIQNLVEIAKVSIVVASILATIHGFIFISRLKRSNS